MLDAGGAWASPIYQKTAFIVLSIIFISGLFVYFFRQKSHYFISSWASIKSWVIAAPLLFIIFGLPAPFPLVILTLIAMNGSKIFFQILGMYHRSYFVLICYAGIIGLAIASYKNWITLYNAMPMIVLALSCLIPLLRNNYKQMIQYISLTLLGFIFLGWSFMHLGLLLVNPEGIYQVMYLIILTEFCDNTILAISRSFPGRKLFNRIDNKRTISATLFSILLTLLLSAAMKFLLPDNNEKYWLTAGLVASLGGVLGDLVMTVVRKDAGVKVVGAFIIGRGDFLRRMDRLIFVAPIFYYVMTLLN
ncbi:MAG TPA: phosphatidate cytidylyltransferase [Pseudobdellovibrionaceae bacterium]|nr:phosphatidate cytidylyltransferase [Pseudobdellovibrionaceae bacterium]